MDLLALQRDRDLQSGLSVYSEPELEPISTAEAKAHLRIDEDVTQDDALLDSLYTAEDALIDALVVTARQHIEDVCGIAMITQTLDYYLEGWPESGEIWLPRAPAVSVASITYTDTEDAEQTASSTIYRLVSSARPPRIVLKDGYEWPSDALQTGLPIKVRYTAGYGAQASSVPKPLKQALLLLVGHYYENREAVIDTGRKTLLPLPLAVDSLIAPYRIHQ